VKLDYRTAAWISVIFGAAALVLELAGWRANYAIGGEPQPLGRIWWHAPLAGAALFAALAAAKTPHV